MFIVNGNVNAWEIERDESANAFTVRNRGNVSFTVKEADLTKLVELTANGSTYVNTDIYPDTGMVVRYDDKTMIPEGHGTGEKRKETMMAAISINVKHGFHITSVYNNGSMIYAWDFDKERYIDFIGNFSESRGKYKFYPSIKIVAINDETGEIMSYNVTYSERKGTVIVGLRRTDKDKNPEKGEKGHVNTFDFVAKCEKEGRPVLLTFYPSSPTNVILVEAGFRDKLIDAIHSTKRWRNSSKYDIREYTDNEVLDAVCEEGYKAVTFYVDNSFRGKDFLQYNPNWREDHPEIELATEKFDIVYVIGQNGGLYKLKINGEVRG